MANRVVITGLGAVTPIGIGKDKFWKGLLAGKSGIGKITRFDATDFKAQIAAEVKDFESDDFIDKKKARRMDRYTQFAIAATKLAFEDAAIDLVKEDKDRIGVFIGTGIGGIETMHEQYKVILEKGPNRVSPFCVPMMIANMATGQTSITFDLHGPSCCPITACATGTNAIGDAMRVIERGEADVMVAGGTEACISPLPVAGFASMKALCTDMNDNPEKASRPFDKNRSGFIMGEGAGIVILESLEHALARGAEIYAEVGGYASTSDAYHITSPDPEARQPARCFTLAVKDAGLQMEDIDYINAHGTSTQLNEKTETAAIKKAFGVHAYKLSVSSIKSMIGHLLGAAGGIECIATALAVKHDIMPATINLDTPDEELDLDYVPNVSRKKIINAAISDSLGFGGHNAAILLKKFK
ncbi:beta-ketoacyl-ACP synthase II [Pectinatus sottacetonis]|uniref:beta-ketoacyl-ACP synthase II n=1 Tax=Pectinatus sottacetonis TaxID=1002795 RepID=UPI0018C6B4FD|nr:beta-ketoacyl-ACP synthase II [Pectinatus sottacetonis]